MLRIQYSITEMAQEESSTIVIQSDLTKKNTILFFFNAENGSR